MTPHEFPFAAFALGNGPGGGADHHPSAQSSAVYPHRLGADGVSQAHHSEKSEADSARASPTVAPGPRMDRCTTEPPATRDPSRSTECDPPRPPAPPWRRARAPSGPPRPGTHRGAVGQVAGAHHRALPPGRRSPTARPRPTGPRAGRSAPALDQVPLGLQVGGRCGCRSSRSRRTWRRGGPRAPWPGRFPARWRPAAPAGSARARSASRT